MTRTERARVALVTGGGRGLGRAHALALAHAGARVVVNDTGEELDGTRSSSAAAEEVAAEIADRGGSAVASVADISSYDGASAAVETAVDAFGGLDAVVSNAGILRDRSFGKMTAADFDAVVQTHLCGAAYIVRAAWDELRASGSGRVVFTTSATGLYGQFGQANYGAAKAGLIGLMNVLKVEGARAGICVNTIAPVARTRMTQALLPADAAEGLGPERVSPAVCYLASAECTDTGLILAVGGGLLSRVQICESAPVTMVQDSSVHSVQELVRQLLKESAGEAFPDVSHATYRMLAAAGHTGPKPI
jgi:NAD(P)-dependent dehydrogenase (short-subunit alcohol dehydrogenase family)